MSAATRDNGSADRALAQRGAMQVDATELPILYRPPAAKGKAAGDLRGTIIQAVKELGDVEWGGVADGHVSRIPVRIERSRLWTHPLFSVEHDDATVLEMAGGLRVHGQLTPLIVTPARDPRSFEQGGTGGEYLVLDGELQLRGSRKSGRVDLEEMECIVQVYDNAYSACFYALAMKASVRELSDEQAGRWLRRLRAVYDAVRRTTPNLAPWPRQEEWARILYRSQSVVSRWLDIAHAHPVVVQAVEDGRLSESAAAEVTPLPRPLQAQVITELDGEREREGSPTIPQRRVRAAVTEQRKGPVQWVSAELPAVPAERLMLGELAEYDLGFALGIVAHDTIQLLSVALGAMQNPHPALLRWQKALQAPEITRFIGQVRSSLSEDESEDAQQE